MLVFGIDTDVALFEFASLIVFPDTLLNKNSLIQYLSLPDEKWSLDLDR